MKRRQFIAAGLGVGALGSLGPLGQESTGLLASAGDTPAGTALLHWRDRTLLGFGSVLSLRAAHSSDEQADRALDAAVATVRHVENLMSLFDPGSAVSRLNRDGVLAQPHPDLVSILTLAKNISAQSQGAFDVTVQPLWRLFDTAAQRQELPPAHDVLMARQTVGWQNLLVSPELIRLGRPGMGITLNGIAQGFAADLVRHTLAQHGVGHALINTGEWAALGRPEPSRSWSLGLADPRQERALIAKLALDGRSIAVSADNQSAFSADHRHHHIFDPRTGYSPTELASVTVAAPSCAQADALTKVMLVAGRTGALRLARQWDVDVLVVTKTGEWEATPGLRLLPA